MSSEALYESIRNSHRENIAQGNISIDPWLHDRENDSRLGISLIIPIRGITDSYRRFLQACSAADGHQYYYPASDLHVTVFDFIRASEHYRQNDALEKKFLGIAEEACGIGVFTIGFKGIVFTADAGIIRGFDNDRLVSIRKSIRALMAAEQLKNDERYESQSAHITFCRFAAPLSDPHAFSGFINRNSGYGFGAERITCFELVEHDWYNLERKKRIIGKIHLADM